MPSFNPPGNNITQRITFNSGTIDFGSGRLVELDNVSIALEYTLVPLYVLNSIQPQDYTRATQKVSLSAKMKSFAPEAYEMAMGSSTGGSPLEIDLLDGQPTLQNPTLTFYDRNNKEYQYQLTGALFKSYKMNAKMEDYAEWDIELEARGMTIVYTQ